MGNALPRFTRMDVYGPCEDDNDHKEVSMDALIAKLEEIKADLAQQAIQALQSDTDIEVHVLAALPKVRQLIQQLKQVQAQQLQNQV